jgi:mannose-1-phosphate guanylyltransferase
MDAPQAWAVILAGGDGTRLSSFTRLVSGEARPKQFCRLYGNRTLLAHTRRRLAPAIPAERTVFAVVKSHERFYNSELADVAPSRLVVQPANRGTTPAIVSSLLRIARLAEDPIVAFFPTDHFYAQETRFVISVRMAIEAVRDSPDMLVVLGASAQHAEVEYGWIEPTEMLPCRFTNSLFRVRRFWEKPSIHVAQTLHARGCLWNTFVMLGRASTFLKTLKAAVPHLLDAFETTLGAGMHLDTEHARALYDILAPGDFSRQVLSVCAEQLAVLKLGHVGWSDLGTPERVLSAIQGSGLSLSMMGARSE